MRGARVRAATFAARYAPIRETVRVTSPSTIDKPDVGADDEDELGTPVDLDRFYVCDLSDRRMPKVQFVPSGVLRWEERMCVSACEVWPTYGGGGDESRETETLHVRNDDRRTPRVENFTRNGGAEVKAKETGLVFSGDCCLRRTQTTYAHLEKIITMNKNCLNMAVSVNFISRSLYQIFLLLICFSSVQARASSFLIVDFEFNTHAPLPGVVCTVSNHHIAPVVRVRKLLKAWSKIDILYHTSLSDYRSIDPYIYYFSKERCYRPMHGSDDMHDIMDHATIYIVKLYDEIIATSDRLECLDKLRLARSSKRLASTWDWTDRRRGFWSQQLSSSMVEYARKIADYLIVESKQCM